MSAANTDSRPGKRARTEEVLTDPAIVRSDALWFDDGNLVLQAGRTQFRVHKSILATRSIFFSDMKNLPQPLGAEEALVDGCPVVELSDDTEAVQYMLECIYDTEKLTKAPSYKQIIFALRMGHKYLVPSLFESAAERVRRQLPSQFTPYSALGTTDAFKWFDHSDNAFELLTVLREVGLEKPVPALCLFYIMEFPAEDIAYGWPNPGQTANPDDVLRMLLARDKIITTQMSYALLWSWDWNRSDRCKKSDQCNAVRSEFRTQALRRLEVLGDGLDDNVLCFKDWEYVKLGLCTHCTTQAKRMHEEGQRRFWTDMPSVLGCKPWEQLQDFKIEA
ncbi:uncharacterized protein SCHCODRAFT_02532055 [Schizophyllum commune H4-8]|nr:uncharacterized protein SCHCODRAFT_02532055 [Schizophyllum commune H4-8]KAI5896308.1 hypothetical protein SCHCODRAFT_02532055 [Schizophyllum commune H4-8]